MTDRELRLALYATDRLLAASRPDEALARLTQLTVHLDAASPENQYEHARQSGWAHGFRQDAPAALAAFTTALAAATRIPEADRQLVLDTRLRWLHEALSIPEIPATRLVAVADEAVAGAAGDPALRRKALDRRAEVLWHVGRNDEAWADIEQMVADAAELSPEERADVLVDAGFRARKLGRKEVGLRWLVEARRLPGTGARFRARLLNALGHAWCEEGDLEQAWSCAEELWALAPGLGRNAQVAACGLRAEVAVPLGRLDEAAEAADLHLQLAEERGLEDETLLYALIDQIDVAGARGHRDRLAAWATRAIPLAERLDRGTGVRRQQEELEKRLTRWGWPG